MKMFFVEKKYQILIFLLLEAWTKRRPAEFDSKSKTGK